MFIDYKSLKSIYAKVHDPQKRIDIQILTILQLLFSIKIVKFISSYFINLFLNFIVYIAYYSPFDILREVVFCLAFHREDIKLQTLSKYSRTKSFTLVIDILIFENSNIF